MLCDDVKRIAYFFLDGQLGEQKQKDLKTHLDDCKDCGDRVTLHRKFRQFIQHRLERCCAPDRLREKILRTFRSTRSES